MVPISYYLVLSGILFACGVCGFLIKRNIITIFMSIELMLNAVNLSFVAFANRYQSLHGHVFVVRWVQCCAMTLHPLRGNPVKQADDQQHGNPAPRAPAGARLAGRRETGTTCGGR